MSFKTAIAKLVFWDNDDRPDIGEATKQLALSLEPLITPPFASAAVRDSAITTSVKNAAPLSGEGLSAYLENVGATEWDGFAWTPKGTRPITTYTANAGQTVGLAANGGVTFVSGINGAAAFTLNRKRMVEVVVRAVIRGNAAAVGSQFRVFVTEAAGEFVDWRDNIAVADGPGAKWSPPMRSAPLAMNPGAHSIGCSVSLTSGDGILTISSLTVAVLDVGPAL